MLQDDPGVLRLPEQHAQGGLHLLPDVQQHPGVLRLLLSRRSAPANGFGFRSEGAAVPSCRPFGRLYPGRMSGCPPVQGTTMLHRSLCKRALTLVTILFCLLLTSCKKQDGKGKEEDGSKANQTDKGDKEKPASKITKANYDRIKKGMTVKEVEAILGPGEGEVKPDDPIAATLEWNEQGKSGRKSDITNITIMFRRGKVIRMDQSGLD
jgi:hypothetical protein